MNSSDAHKKWGKKGVEQEQEKFLEDEGRAVRVQRVHKREIKGECD